jgi:hypothetical protein
MVRLTSCACIGHHDSEIWNQDAALRGSLPFLLKLQGEREHEKALQ